MATVTKDFKVKNGLIVEGTTGTINNHDILTKKTDDQNYIIGLIGGSSDSANTPNTVVKRDGSGNFAAGEITADLVGNVTGNADTATTLETSRTIELIGDVTGSVSFNGSQNVQISTTIDGNFATDAELSSAISQEVLDRNSAISTASGNLEDYADNAASNALSAAESYTDSSISTEVTNRNSAISSAISTEVTNRNSAIATAKSEAISTASSDATTKANAAEANANNYTDTAITNLNLAGTYDALGAAASALTDANTYTDGKVADLVDSAPALLDTLNELAAAIADNPNYASDVANLVGTKQDALTAGEGIYIDNANVITGRQQSGGGLKFVFNEAAIDRSTVDGWYDASGAAASAQSNAQSYADDAAFNAQMAAESYASNAASNAQTAAQSYADTAASNAQMYAETYADGVASDAQSNAESFTTNAINALTTSDIEEGSNLYYTDYRATDAAGALLAGASKTNINISYSPLTQQLTVEAENGVADSTTDDLDEGINNLYFTNARAVSALEAVTPQFQEIDVTWATKNTAAYTYVANASTATAFSWNTNYASAKFLVRVRSGNHSQVSEVLVTADNSNNLAVTEYAMVGTNGNLGNVSANFSGGNYNLTVETTENNSEVIVYATLMAYGD